MILLAHGLRSVWRRRTNALATAFCIALVVFVLSASLMLAAGIRATLGDAGSSERALVLEAMYGTIADRSREIGTLRALGFSARDILLTLLLESTILASAGGALPCAPRTSPRSRQCARADRPPTGPSAGGGAAAPASASSRTFCTQSAGPG